MHKTHSCIAIKLHCQNNKQSAYKDHLSAAFPPPILRRLSVPLWRFASKAPSKLKARHLSGFFFGFSSNRPFFQKCRYEKGASRPLRHSMFKLFSASLRRSAECVSRLLQAVHQMSHKKCGSLVQGQMPNHERLQRLLLRAAQLRSLRRFR